MGWALARLVGRQIDGLSLAKGKGTALKSYRVVSLAVSTEQESASVRSLDAVRGPSGAVHHTSGAGRAFQNALPMPKNSETAVSSVCVSQTQTTQNTHKQKKAASGPESAGQSVLKRTERSAGKERVPAAAPAPAQPRPSYVSSLLTPEVQAAAKRQYEKLMAQRKHMAEEDAQLAREGTTAPRQKGDA